MRGYFDGEQTELERLRAREIARTCALEKVYAVCAAVLWTVLGLAFAAI